jgi:hypothetical protein
VDPDGQADEPVTVFGFVGVTIENWTDTSLPGAQPVGHVRDFHWNFGIEFALDMYDVSPTFRALSLQVRTEAWDESTGSLVGNQLGQASDGGPVD